MIKVGIVGCGFIGSALRDWLKNHNTDVCIKISDPPKNYNDDLSDCDVIFISIHIPTEDDATQDLTLLKSILQKLPNCPIFIRTTLLPGTTDALSHEFNKKIYFMPEFLTERTAYDDFSKQSMVFCGEFELLQKIFGNKKFIRMTNYEAELAKYAHNVFGALKVTYFNGIYQLCKKHGLDFHSVRDGILLSGYINDVHTLVPGPDKKLGYGGKCFPKDVNAFIKYLEEDDLYNLIKDVQLLNNKYRG